jgi:hypothetical protein
MGLGGGPIRALFFRLFPRVSLVIDVFSFANFGHLVIKKNKNPV